MLGASKVPASWRARVYFRGRAARQGLSTKVWPVNLSITINAKELIDRLEFAEKQINGAIRNGLMRGARTARREALETSAADIGVSATRARAGQPTVRNPAGALVAVWNPSKRPANIGSTGATWSKAAGVSASTYRLTGGPSAALAAPHAFTMRGRYGGSFVLNRIKHGFGTGHDRSALAKIFAESVGTGMGEANGAPRARWTASAERVVPVEIGASLQHVLDGYAAGGDSGGE